MSKDILKEKDLPKANETHRISKESDSAYNNIVHNIIVGIMQTTEKGSYEYQYFTQIPKCFGIRIYKWLKEKGYEVEIKEVPSRTVRSILGKDIESVNVFIKWH